MMKRIQKIVATILATLMILSSAPLSAIAANGIDYDLLANTSASGTFGIESDESKRDGAWSYDAESKTLYIDIYDGVKTLWGNHKYRNNNSPNGYLPDPSVIEGNGVWDSNTRYAMYQIHLNKIVLGKNIEEIGNIDFNLFDVDVVEFEEGSACYQIGNNVFKKSDDAGAWKVDITNLKNLKQIYSSAFYNADIIGDFSTLTKLESVRNRAFYQSRFENRSITIPLSVKTFGDEAFMNCNVSDLTILGACEDFESKNLFKSSDVERVTFPTFDTDDYTIPYGMFEDCRHLSSVDLGSVTAIDNYAFKGSAIENIDLSNVKVFGRACFRDTNVTNIDLQSAMSIGRGAFQDCPLGDLDVTPNQKCDIQDYAFAGARIDNLYIGANVCSIGRCAFDSCDIKNLTFENPFDNRTIDTSKPYEPVIQMTIDWCAFIDNNNLKSVVFTPNIKSLADWSFSCTNLSDVKFLSATEHNHTTGEDITYKMDYIHYWAFRDSKVSNSSLKGQPISVDYYQNSTVTVLDFSKEENIVLGEASFAECPNLRKVILPDYITEIPDACFENCPNLETVILPKNLTRIGEYAFYGTSLSKIDIPDSVTYIGEKSFADTKMTTLDLPDGLTTINRNLFYGMKSLESVNIPKNVRYISDNAFHYSFMNEVTFDDGCPVTLDNCAFNGADSLHKVDFNNRVHTISYQAFQNLNNLEEVNLDGVVVIDKNAFRATAIKNLKLPPTLKRINNGAFSYCNGLSCIDFGYGEDLIIEPNAFLYDNNLNKLNINARVKEIGANAFSECANLTSVNLESFKYQGEDTVHSFGNVNKDAFRTGVQITETSVIVDKPNSIAAVEQPLTADMLLERNNRTYTFQYGLKRITKETDKNLGFYDDTNNPELYVIPNTVTEIGKEAFKGLNKMRAVIIPASVKRISSDAFAECSSLEFVVFEDGSMLESIGDHAFENCKSLISVDIPNSVTKFGIHLFEGCGLEEFTFPSGMTEIPAYMFASSNLKSITIPGNIKKINNMAFYYCTSLTDVIIEEGVEYISSDVFRASKIKNFSFPSTLTYLGGGNLPVANIDTVDLTNTKIESIPSYFAQNASIETLKLPETVKSINDRAFIDCKVKHIELPQTLEYIGDYAFTNTKLEELNIPDSVLHIGSNIIKGTNIESIVLPASLSSLGNETFSETVLTNIDMSKCNNLKVISEKFAYSCRRLVELELPKNVQEVGDSAFYRCSQLDNLYCPESLATVGPSGFSQCTSLRFTNIPNIKTVGKYGFSECKNLGVSNCFKSLEYVDDYAFMNCSFDSLELGDIKHIGKYAFNNAGLYNIDYLYITSMDCEFPDELNMRPTRVYAKIGSTAQQYAKKNNDKYPGQYMFVPIGDDGEILSEDGIVLDNYVVGTWYGGDWSIDRNGLDYTLRINGSGTIYTDSFFDEKGNKIDFYDTIRKYHIVECVFTGDIDNIPNSMFKNVKSIERVILPPNLISIGTYAFYGTGLKSIELPQNMQKLNSYAFANTELKSVTIPSTVTSINSYAFANSKLENVNISEGVRIISSYAFMNTNLKYVDIPKSVTNIAAGAFLDCEELTDYYIPAPVKVISNSTPSTGAIGCLSNGTQVKCVVHCAVDSMAYNYTKNYNNITAVFDLYSHDDYRSDDADVSGKFDNSDCVWHYYKDTKSIYLYGTVSLDAATMLYEDGTQVNKGDLDVDTVYIEAGISELTTSNSDGSVISMLNPKYIILPNTLRNIGRNTFKNCTNLNQLNIPDSVIKIDSGAFDGCTGLESLFIGSGLTNIADGLFSSSPKLKYLSLSRGIKSIGNNAFFQCTNLESITIPDSVVSIGDMAFYHCYNLKTLTLGTNLTSIGEKAFADCVQCESVTIKSNSVFSDDVLQGLGVGTTGATVTFGDNVEVARLDMFAKYNVDSIVLGKKVKSVVNSDYMTTLRSITVFDENPNLAVYYDSLYTKNGDKLVLVPAKLTQVTIPDGVKVIGTDAFLNSGVSSVDIPNSVETIEPRAFASATQLKRINIPNKVTVIDNSTFIDCKSLRSVNIAESVITIGESAFENCISLPTLILPSNLNEISDRAFYNCTKLEGMVVPRFVSTIGDNAFAKCPALKSIYLWRCNIGENNFLDSKDLNAFVIVATKPYEYVRENDIKCTTYTDQMLFKDVCAASLDIYSGFIGLCDGDHGDVEWLTVYANDCENDGYMIGVCEFCSEIIEERHIDATGHSYKLVAEIEPTAYTQGRTVYTCENCDASYCDYIPATDSLAPKTVTVKGRVTVAQDKNASSSEMPVSNVSVIKDGKVIATTDEDGYFSTSLSSGVYNLTLHYAYGIDRNFFVVVSHKNIDCGSISILACDFNKDGKIDEDDYTMFMYVTSSKKDDESYLSFVDLNNDGYINAKDRIILKNCMYTNYSFTYDTMVIKA